MSIDGIAWLSRSGTMRTMALVLCTASMMGCAGPSSPQRSSTSPLAATTDPSADSRSTPEPSSLVPSLTAASSPDLLSLDEAVAIARAFPEGCYSAVCNILSAELLPWREVGLPATYGPPPGPDDPVWYIDLGSHGGPTGGQGARYAIDAKTGKVIGVSFWIG